MERHRDDAAAPKTEQKLLHLPRRRGLAQLVHRDREGEGGERRRGMELEWDNVEPLCHSE